MPKSINDLKQEVSVLIQKQRLNKALCIIENHVACIVTNPLCTANVFGSQVLDDLCQEIGLENAKALIGVSNSPINAAEQDTFIYIASKIQASGGHTRLIAQLINERPNAQHLIIITGIAGRSDIKYFNNFISTSAHYAIQELGKGSRIKKLTQLQNKLLRISYTNIYLLNHHQDSIAVAAVAVVADKKTIFYHHGDHHLSLGVHMKNVIHVDMHPMGFNTCRNQCGITNNYYLPLFIQDRGVLEGREFLKEGYLVTCTAARANKIEIPYFAQYTHVIPMLLKETGGKHIHIGKLGWTARLKIKFNLWRLCVDQKRFIYLPWSESVWNTLGQYHVDAYIASFPYGGGLTLIEAMGSATPVILHQHIYSDVLSGIALAPLNTFHWRYPSDLLNYCKSLTSSILEDQSIRVRAHYKQFYSNYQPYHDPTSCESIVSKQNFLMAPQDEIATWIDKQTTITKQVKLFVRRVLLKARAFIHNTF